ncbi:MAG: hypothetical protein EOP09_08135 [Proteobacteria bacterium]|nr:MAG: hypothetical protein EOP09_08135 [Pseudomonadota bacterium]
MSGLSPPNDNLGPRPARVAPERREIDPQVKEAAAGLESLFLDTMYKAMRKTVQSSELSLENNATAIYRDMLDSETAKRSAAQNSIGLADQIVAYLESRGYNTKKTESPKEPVIERRTGGTDENSAIRPE